MEVANVSFPASLGQSLVRPSPPLTLTLVSSAEAKKTAAQSPKFYFLATLRVLTPHNKQVHIRLTIFSLVPYSFRPSTEFSHQFSSITN